MVSAGKDPANIRVSHRLRRDLTRLWGEPTDVPAIVILAAVWAFLSGSPSEERERLIIAAGWGFGEDGVARILRDLEPHWIEEGMRKVLPDLKRGPGLQNMRKLQDWLLELKPGTLANRRSVKTQVKTVEHGMKLMDDATDPDSSFELIPYERREPSGSSLWSRSLAVLEDAPPAPQTIKLLSNCISTDERLRDFPAWLAELDESTIGHTIYGCEIHLSFCGHSVRKFVQFDETRLWFRYELVCHALESCAVVLDAPLLSEAQPFAMARPFLETITRAKDELRNLHAEK